ncbi:hypothetical protein H8E88_12290 [candidate division KSB1 bacterium]|nr:hypothetical protein [candidate division KSB1 bacterium]
MSKSKQLVVFDTDQIHNYVFATSKLKEIRGSSAIISHLTKSVAEDLNGRSIIFLAGGSGKIIFDSHQQAKVFCQSLQNKLLKLTDGMASVTTVITDYDESDFERTMQKSEIMLRMKKDMRQTCFQPLSNPWFKICESEGNVPAEQIDPVDKKLIAASSQLKRNSGGKDIPVYQDFLDFITQQDALKNSKWHNLLNQDPTKIYNKDLNALGEFGNGYIGIIYADGNRMGLRLEKKCKKKSDYKKLGDTVTTAIRESLFHSINSNLSSNDSFKTFPFEIFLIGGDDVILAVPALFAIPIAMDMCYQFKKATVIKELAPKGISISAGIVLTHANYPIHQTIQYAEQLLKSAKSLSNREPDAEHNCIDFMVVKNAKTGDITEIRSNELSYNDDNQGICNLYQRPYLVEKLHGLVKHIQDLKSKSFPRTRLRQMHDSLYSGRGQSTLDLCMMMWRISDEHSKIIKKYFLEQLRVSHFPWDWDEEKRAYTTGLLDIIELYNFIDKEGTL